MHLDSMPPLDLQTQHLERDQHPSGRMLLLVAALSVGGLFVSWATHRDAIAQGPVPGTTQVAKASMADGLGPMIISRVVLRHK